ncbi:hypothetical protein A3759_14425 [Thalassolituus sp. HI0120]|nr:hypothetical protein A3759_14425 [Thalassolituus sp. HI0120]
MSPAPRFSVEQQLAMVKDAAVHCIEETSLLSFTMASVAKQAGLSMGSVYKQVQSKEDLLIALAVDMFEHEHETSEKIMALSLTTPEILIAFNLIDFHKTWFYSFSDELNTLVGSDSIIKRASPVWLRRMIDAANAIGLEFTHLIGSAVENGEVDREGRDPSELVKEIEVGSWALCHGYMQAVLRHHTRNALGAEAALPFPLTTDDSLIRNTQRLLNTYTWQQPLTNDGIQKVAQQLTDIGYR